MKDNIFMMSWDSVRADHMSFDGYGRETTPTLTSTADNGLVFDQTYVSGVGTPTSFTGILTGEHAHGVQTNISPEHWQESNADRRMLQEALQDEGYYTGGFHANALMSRHYGWNRGWDEFEDHLWTQTSNSGGTHDDVSLKTAIDDGRDWWSALKKTTLHPTLQKMGVASEAIHIKNLVLGKEAYAPWESLWESIEAFVREAPEPWFLWVLLVDTHHPWCAPPEYREWDQPGLREMHLRNYAMRKFPKRTGYRNQKIVNAYDNELLHADAFYEQVKDLFNETSTDPAIVMHSDHGDELGEHGDYGHAPAMWDTVARVPLVMENVGETGRVEGPHSLLDLGSTILDIAGSEERLADRTSLLEGGTDEPVHIENRTQDGEALQATVHDGRKLVDVPGVQMVQYNIVDDRMEHMPMKPSNEIVRLHEQVRRPDPSEMSGTSDGLDDDLEERLVNLGYK